jgi:hypothetical protein
VYTEALVKVFNAQRVSIVVDEDSGLVVGLRARPSGFIIPISEVHVVPSDYDSNPPAIRAITAEGSIPIPGAGSDLGPVEMVFVETVWRLRAEASITRIFVTPRVSVAQRLEHFMFQYEISESVPSTSVQLLRFTGVDKAYQDGRSGFNFESGLHRINVHVSGNRAASWTIRPDETFTEYTFETGISAEG